MTTGLRVRWYFSAWIGGSSPRPSRCAVPSASSTSTTSAPFATSRGDDAGTSARPAGTSAQMVRDGRLGLVRVVLGVPDAEWCAVHDTQPLMVRRVEARPVAFPTPSDEPSELAGGVPFPPAQWRPPCPVVHRSGIAISDSCLPGRPQANSVLRSAASSSRSSPS
jgi:hypothetical protein